MIIRIEVISKIPDPRATSKKRKLESFGYKGKIANAFLVDVYTIDKKFEIKRFFVIIFLQNKSACVYMYLENI